MYRSLAEWCFGVRSVAVRILIDLFIGLDFCVCRSNYFMLRRLRHQQDYYVVNNIVNNFGSVLRHAHLLASRANV